MAGANNGKHFDGGSQGARRQTATLETQGEHKAVVAELRKPEYPDYSTYDIKTKKIITKPSGYQVTFWQIGDRYSDAEYAEKTNEFLRVSSDGRTYAGKFEGTPEVSFHVRSKKVATTLAKKYNQISVWDWKKQVEIKTGGTGRRN